MMITADPATRLVVLLGIRADGYDPLDGDVSVFKTPTQDQTYWSVEAIVYDPDLINVRGYYAPDGKVDLVYVPAFEGDPFEGL